MIYFILGGFGSGKSYAGMRLIRHELLNGNRPVVTNLAVKEREFAQYLPRRFPKSHVVLHQRLRLLKDEEVGQFYLHRVSRNHLWYDVPAPDPDAEKRGARPDWSLLRDSGIYYVIEEAHEFFNARYWQEIGRCFGAYKNQNRKFNDDIIFITPQISEIDKQLRQSGLNYTLLTNLGQRKIKGITLPSLFLAREFSTMPDKNSEPLNTYRYTLDKELADCYDTAKGVRGVQGGLADKERKLKGIPWWIFALAFVAIGLTLTVGVKLYADHVLRPLKHKGPLFPKKIVRPVSVNSPSSDAHDPVRRVTAPVLGVPSGPGRGYATNGVFCTGWCYVSGVGTAFLSDGTTWSSADHDIDFVRNKEISIHGVIYLIRQDLPALMSVPAYSPAPSGGPQSASNSQNSFSSTPSQVITIPNHRLTDVYGGGSLSPSSSLPNRQPVRSNAVLPSYPAGQ